MAMPLPQKIVLKNSTTMSLNDRFSRITAIRAPSNRQTVSMNKTSLQNQRLAQIMANRDLLEGLSLASRLGVPSVKSRLGYRAGSVMSLRAYGTPVQRRQSMMHSTPITQRPRRGVTGVRNTPSTRQNLFNSYPRGVSKVRGQFQGTGRVFYSSPQYNNSTPVGRGRGRGRGGARGGGARGGARGAYGNKSSLVTNPTREIKTAEQLDTELEEYMAVS